MGCSSFNLGVYKLKTSLLQTDYQQMIVTSKTSYRFRTQSEVEMTFTLLSIAVQLQNVSLK